MTWDEIRDEVYELTKRPDLTAETAIAIRNAIRTAHSTHKFWRDLTEITVPNLDTSESVQDIDLTLHAPKLRQVASLAPASNPDAFLHPIGIQELLDTDGYVRTNVFWGFGTNIRVRAATPESSYILQFYSHPTVSPTTALDSWIVDEHGDYIVTMAAMTVLDLIGEQEIRGRVAQLAAVSGRHLLTSNLEIASS